jgi:hypothetical protein
MGINIHYNNIYMIRKLVILSLTFFLLSCTHRHYLYFNGEKVFYTKERIANTVDTLITYYYENGNFKGVSVIKNGKQVGGGCFFSQNGNIDFTDYYINGMPKNNRVIFGDSGKIKAIYSYHNGYPIRYLSFSSDDVTLERPDVDMVIKNGGPLPFVTVDPDADTITLGKTYSARIVCNFPLKKFDCRIAAMDSTGKAYIAIEEKPECIYTETPKTLGEHIYKISVYQREITAEYPQRSPSTLQINFSVKYFVKAAM